MKDDCSAASKGDSKEHWKDDCWETLMADRMEDSMAHETVWSTAASTVENWDYMKDDCSAAVMVGTTELSTENQMVAQWGPPMATWKDR